VEEKTWSSTKKKAEGLRCFKNFWKRLDSEVTVRRHPDFGPDEMFLVDIECGAFQVRDMYEDIMETKFKSTSNMQGKGFIQYKEHPNWQLGDDEHLTMALKYLLFDLMQQHGPKEAEDNLVRPESAEFMTTAQLQSTIQTKSDFFLSRQDPHRDYSQEYLDGFNRRVQKKLGRKSNLCYYPWAFDMPLTDGGMQLSAFVQSETADNQTTFSERRLVVEKGSILMWRGDLVHAGGYPAPRDISNPASRIHGHFPVYCSRGGAVSPNKETVSIDRDHNGRKMAPMTTDELGRPWLYKRDANSVAMHRDDNSMPALCMHFDAAVSFHPDNSV
jgi:hypothetical protein